MEAGIEKMQGMFNKDLEELRTEIKSTISFQNRLRHIVIKVTKIKRKKRKATYIIQGTPMK